MVVAVVIVVIARVRAPISASSTSAVPAPPASPPRPRSPTASCGGGGPVVRWRARGARRGLSLIHISEPTRLALI
eukprot:6933437-Alexandrium_andersonii.AAC.1